jgi:hypothetical protein
MTSFPPPWHEAHKPPPKPPPVKPPAEPPAADLELRIAEAFRASPPGDDVERLLAEARAAAEFAVEDALRKVTAALDPALSGEDAQNAKRAMEASLFGRDRSDAAVARLSKRLVELREREEQAKRRKAYEAAREERDALAEELASNDSSRSVVKSASDHGSRAVCPCQSRRPALNNTDGPRPGLSLSPARRAEACTCPSLLLSS